MLVRDYAHLPGEASAATLELGNHLLRSQVCIVKHILCILVHRELQQTTRVKFNMSVKLCCAVSIRSDFGQAHSKTSHICLGLSPPILQRCYVIGSCSCMLCVKAPKVYLLAFCPASLALQSQLLHESSHRKLC